MATTFGFEKDPVVRPTPVPPQLPVELARQYAGFVVVKVRQPEATQFVSQSVKVIVDIECSVGHRGDPY